jgi:hypothetical protein
MMAKEITDDDSAENSAENEILNHEVRIPAIPEHETMAVIATYPDGGTAAISAALLRSRGIPAEMIADLGGDVFSVYGLTGRQVELIVPESFQDRAVQLLLEAANSRPDERIGDWECTGCGEVNGEEFDACWSCGVAWSPSSRKHVAESQDGAPEIASPPIHYLTDTTRNPYAAPEFETVAEMNSPEEIEFLLRRQRQCLVVGMLLPPLLLVAIGVGISGLRRAAMSRSRASFTQLMELVMLTAIAIGVLLLILTFFL